jgi:hypothetical protein
MSQFYSSRNVIRVTETRKIGLVGYIDRMGRNRKVYKILTGKPERKRPFGRLTLTSEDNIKMVLREMGSEMRTGLIWLTTRTNGGLLSSW